MKKSSESKEGCKNSSGSDGRTIGIVIFRRHNSAMKRSNVKCVCEYLRDKRLRWHCDHFQAVPDGFIYVRHLTFQPHIDIGLSTLMEACTESRCG